MERLTIVTGNATAWLQPDVDTDTITPMRRVLENGAALGTYSFEAYRFLGGTGDSGIKNPDFPLNYPENRDAVILIVGPNFGCGSSRETAPEGIRMCGYRVLIGSSFGTIFFKNCCQQGVLPVVISEDQVRKLASYANNSKSFYCVNLEECTITAPNGEVIEFSLSEYRRQGLLNGLDDVRTTLIRKEKIDDYFSRDRILRPWIWTMI